MKQLIVQEDIIAKKNNKNNNKNSNNNDSKNNNNNNAFDADDAELMNADAVFEQDGDDNSNDDSLSYEEKLQQMNSRAARFKQIWPQNVLPEVWVPDVVKQLIQIGAIENENAGIENRRPCLRLTQKAFNAAWNEIVEVRAAGGAKTILPSELQRRKNLNQRDRKKKKNVQKRKAKREGEKKAVIMEKKMNKIKTKKAVKKYNGSVTAVKRKGAGKKRGK